MQEHGHQLDEREFDAAMQEQRTRARAAMAAYGRTMDLLRRLTEEAEKLAQEAK